VTEQALLLAVVALAFFSAGLVKGVIGLGLPTVAMGLLGLAMPPVQAAALLVLPSLVTNLWQMFRGPGLVVLLRRMSTMSLGIVAGTFVGIGVLTGGENALAPGVLGVVLVAYAVAGLLAVRFAVPPRLECWLSPLVGTVTGALTGATGLFVVPAVPYINSLGLEKEDLIQALGLSFTVSTLALGAALALNDGFAGVLAPGRLIALPLALAAVLAGMAGGQLVRRRLAPEVFRRWFFIALLLLGLYMLQKVLRQA
jgi:hypothetical protein